MENFANLMNKYAKKLNLKNTHFYNASGLDEKVENKSTAYDMSLIMSYAMKNDVFKKIVGTKNYKTKSSYKTYSWQNKNRLLFSYEYATGGKTGYTKKANRTLVTSASKDDMNVIIVTLNDGNDFLNHKNLYEKVFKEYYSLKLLDKNITSLEKNKKIYYVKNNYSLMIKKGEEQNIEVKYLYYKKKVNNIGGKVEIYYKDKLVYKDHLYIKDKKPNKIISIYQKIKDWFLKW